MGESQQSFGDKIGVTLPTVGAWETTDPPKNIALANLERVAREKGHADLADVFHAALEEMKETQWRKANDILDEIERWQKIKGNLEWLRAKAERIREAGLTKDADEMVEGIDAFWETLAAAQRWSWRNK
jgi:hypothetical protein